MHLFCVCFPDEQSYDYLICSGPEGTDFTMADGQELRMLRLRIFQNVSQKKKRVIRSFPFFLPILYVLLSLLKWNKLLHFITLLSFGVKLQPRGCDGNPRGMELAKTSEVDSSGNGRSMALVLLCSQLPRVTDLANPSSHLCPAASPQHTPPDESG